MYICISYYVCRDGQLFNNHEYFTDNNWCCVTFIINHNQESQLYNIWNIINNVLNKTIIEKHLMCFIGVFCIRLLVMINLLVRMLKI